MLAMAVAHDSPALDLTAGWVDLTGEPGQLLGAAIGDLAGKDRPNFFYLGRRPYMEVWQLQKEVHQWRVNGTVADTVLFVEHDPVYTLGRNAGDAHLLQVRPSDAAVVQSDRGGDVTFHGPGQLVGYPIVSLSSHQFGVSRYLRELELAIIRALETYGVYACQMEGLTGVWVHRRKVASLGVRLARWTSTHGFAINVDVSMSYFDGIVPCGILEYGVVNLNEVMEHPTTVRELAQKMSVSLNRMLEG